MPHARPTILIAAAPLIALAALQGPGALAQPPDPGQPAGMPSAGPPGGPLRLEEAAFIQPPWTIQVEPSLWFTSPGGYIQLPGGPGRTRVDTFNLDSPHPSPYAEVHLRSGGWRLAFSGMAYSAENRGSIQGGAGEIGGIPYGPGTPVRASLDFTSFHAEVGYRLPVFGRLRGESEPDLLTFLEATGGVRFHLLDIDLELPGGHAGGREFVGAPFLGLRLSMEVVRKITVDGTINIALFSEGSDLTLAGSDIAIGVSYRPIENVGVQVGYRQIALDINDDGGAGEFSFEEGAFAGVFAGVVIRF